MNYEELVKALRHCMTKEDGITICEPCPYYGKGIECENVLHTDAAAAIEELQAEVKEWRRLNDENLLPKRRQPHWVSVFDDLPRHNAVVVVSDGKRSWDVGQYHFLFKSDDRTIWWWKKHTTRKVLWWMYKEDALPQPPQEVQDGPIITPCRGCSDYDGYGGCKSKGGCARAKMEVQE